MSEVVTGCMFRGCPLEPEWLIRGQFYGAYGQPDLVDLQICNEHLSAFGIGNYDVSTGWKFTGSNYTKVDIYADRPQRIKVVRSGA